MDKDSTDSSAASDRGSSSTCCSNTGTRTGAAGVALRLPAATADKVGFVVCDDDGRVCFGSCGTGGNGLSCLIAGERALGLVVEWIAFIEGARTAAMAVIAHDEQGGREDEVNTARRGVWT